MQALLELPGDLLRHEFFPLLLPRDVCALDAAVSSRPLRRLLLQLYRSLTPSLTHSPRGLTLHQMLWFFTRGVPLRSICFDPSLRPQEVADIFEVLQSAGSCCGTHSCSGSACTCACACACSGTAASSVRHLTLSPFSDSAGGLHCFQLLTLCTHLHSLTLLDCKAVAAPVLEALRALHTTRTRLHSLDLSACSEITDEFLEALSEGCPSLTSLNLSHSHEISGVAVRTLAERTSLRALDLSDCAQVECDALVGVARCAPCLTSLKLMWCTRVDDTVLLALAHCCVSLSCLSVCGCALVTDVGVVAIAQSCHSLTALELGTCGNITDASVIALCRGRGAPLLTRLDLGYCSQLTSCALQCIARDLPLLQVLIVSSLERVSEDGFVDLAAGCPSLTELDVSKNATFTDRCMESLTVNHPRLMKFDGSHCQSLTDASARCLARSGVSLTLKSLRLNCCEQLTAAGVVTLARACPNLCELSLCRIRLTEEAAQSIAHGCRSLTSLSLGGCGSLSNAVLAALASSKSLIRFLNDDNDDDGDGY